MKYVIVIAMMALLSACSSTPKQEVAVVEQVPTGAYLYGGPRNYYGGDTNNMTIVYSRHPQQQPQQSQYNNRMAVVRPHYHERGNYSRQQVNYPQGGSTRHHQLAPPPHRPTPGSYNQPRNQGQGSGQRGSHNHQGPQH